MNNFFVNIGPNLSDKIGVADPISLENVDYSMFFPSIKETEIEQIITELPNKLRIFNFRDMTFFVIFSKIFRKRK